MSKKNKAKGKSIDMQQLRKRCTMPVDAFSEEFTVYPSPDGTRYWLRETPGAQILFVGHLDVVDAVERMQHFEFANIPGTPLLFNAWLDDRLGVYLGADFLPSLGVKCDVLLTENEEHCASTARDFETDKAYNWMFMFDRGGEDVVMYEYHTEELAKLLREVGYTVSRGTYSCIRELEHLGISGFNFGTGYYDNHGKMGYANLAHTIGSVNRFVKFYNKHAGERFPYVQQPKVTYTYNNSTWGGNLGTHTATCPTCSGKAWTGDIIDFGECYRCHYGTAKASGGTTLWMTKCPECKQEAYAATITQYGSCYNCRKAAGKVKELPSKVSLNDEWTQCKMCAVWVPSRDLDKAERCKTCQQATDYEEEKPCPMCRQYTSEVELEANEGYCKKCYTEGWEW